MLDKRCKYRYKERHQFYLYIKYPQSHIYYAKFPEFGYKSISTGKTNLREAYIKGCEIYKYLFYNTTFDWGIEDKFILERLPKTPDKLTVEIIQKIQNELLETGISGKTVNNRMGVLHKYIAFPPVAHKKVIRKCYPIEKLYGLGSQYTLAFIAITTGMRKGEFDNCEAITDNGKLYLQINGTKTDNSVRKVPIIPETVKALEDYKKRKWTDRDFRKSVDEVGELIGIDPYKDNIVFHSFRKCYKTAMMSAGINDVWQEYFMGHSIEESNVVSKLYFIPEAADDNIVYGQMIELLKRFV